MMITVGTGVALAFVAMLCWGFGDFLIQRSTRRLGDWETLFVITFLGGIVLTPFVWRSLPALFVNSDSTGLFVLLAASAVLFGAALLDLEALRRGKLAVVEPIWSFEIVSASVLGIFVLGEQITRTQYALIILLIVGLMFTAFREKRITKKVLLEKGVAIALIAALAMGCSNFLMGWGGRVTDPILTKFFTDAFLAIGSGAYLLARGAFGAMFRDIRESYGLVIPMAISDNAAWVAYIFSMTLVPIAIATALSESYIIITVMLGLIINKERLQRHQKIGLVMAVVAAVVLAAITAR